MIGTDRKSLFLAITNGHRMGTDGLTPDGETKKLTFLKAFPPHVSEQLNSFLIKDKMK